MPSPLASVGRVSSQQKHQPAWDHVCRHILHRTDEQEATCCGNKIHPVFALEFSFMIVKNLYITAYFAHVCLFHLRLLQECQYSKMMGRSRSITESYAYLIPLQRTYSIHS